MKRGSVEQAVPSLCVKNHRSSVSVAVAHACHGWLRVGQGQWACNNIDVCCCSWQHHMLERCCAFGVLCVGYMSSHCKTLIPLCSYHIWQCKLFGGSIHGCMCLFSCVLKVVLSQLQLYGAECLMVTDFPKYNKHTCTRTCMYTYVTDIMFPAIQGVTCSIIGKCTASQY